MTLGARQVFITQFSCSVGKFSKKTGIIPAAMEFYKNTTNFQGDDFFDVSNQFGYRSETFENCIFLFEFMEDENFNSCHHPIPLSMYRPMERRMAG